MSKAKAQRPMRPSVCGLSTPGHQRVAGGCFSRRGCRDAPTVRPVGRLALQVSKLVRTDPGALAPRWAAALARPRLAHAAVVERSHRSRGPRAPLARPAGLRVYQDEQGRWMVYRHGRKPQEIDWANPPPERSDAERSCRACSAGRRSEGRSTPSSSWPHLLRPSISLIREQQDRTSVPIDS
jgi:hypothetical protein